MSKYRSDDIYYTVSPLTMKCIRELNSSNRINNDYKLINRMITYYDYIIISNNNYQSILKTIDNSKYKILILEKNNEVILENINNISFRTNTELLSIEKYIHDTTYYCVFDKNNINYFTSNLILGSNSIMDNIVFNNTFTSNTSKYNTQTPIVNNNANTQLDVNDKKYYVYKNVNNISPFFLFKKNKSDSSYIPYTDIKLLAGSTYVFEYDSNYDSNYIFNIGTGLKINSSTIVFKSTSRYFRVNGIGSLFTKGQQLEFTIPDNFNKKLYYYNPFNTFSKKLEVIYKKNIKKINMILSFNKHKNKL